MGEAFIELLQHIRRLLSAFYHSSWIPSFALTVREAFIELFQHFQRLLSLSYCPVPSGRLYDITQQLKMEIPMMHVQ